MDELFQFFGGGGYKKIKQKQALEPAYAYTLPQSGQTEQIKEKKAHTHSVWAARNVGSGLVKKPSPELGHTIKSTFQR